MSGAWLNPAGGKLKKMECKKFDLEKVVDEGPVKTDLRGFLDLFNVELKDIKRDYLIHLEYFPEEKKYRFKAYREKHKQ